MASLSEFYVFINEFLTLFGIGHFKLKFEVLTSAMAAWHASTKRELRSASSRFSPTVDAES